MSRSRSIFISSAVGVFAGIFAFSIFYCYIELNPIAGDKYVLTCLEGEEQRALLIEIADLKGRVEVMQKMIPVFTTLLVSVVLFLTWTQKGVAKSTAIDEINDNFKTYKDRIEELLDQANDLTEKIKIKHEGICDLSEISLADIAEAANNRKANEQKN